MMTNIRLHTLPPILSSEGAIHFLLSKVSSKSASMVFLQKFLLFFLWYNYAPLSLSKISFLTAFPSTGSSSFLGKWSWLLSLDLSAEADAFLASTVDAIPSLTDSTLSNCSVLSHLQDHSIVQRLQHMLPQFAFFLELILQLDFWTVHLANFAEGWGEFNNDKHAEWSVNTVQWCPSRYGRKCFAAQTTANVSIPVMP